MKSKSYGNITVVSGNSEQKGVLNFYCPSPDVKKVYVESSELMALFLGCSLPWRGDKAFTGADLC